MEFSEAHCPFHEIDSLDCRSLQMYEATEDKTCFGSIAFMRFSDDGYMIHCYTTQPDEENICSINGIGFRSREAP